MKIDEKLVNAVAKELAGLIFNGKPAKRKVQPKKKHNHSLAMKKAWARRKRKKPVVVAPADLTK